MNPLKSYIGFIDGCMADATSKSDVLRVDLLGMPLAIVAIFTVVPAIILRVAGAPEVWGTILGTLLLGLVATHFLALFWRWSIFDYDDHIGKTCDPHYEDFP